MNKYTDDYFWKFEGLNKVLSRVHIRLVHEENKPFVIVCSQPIYGAGTSVQNAYMMIKDHLWGVITTRLNYKVPGNKLFEIERLKDAIKNGGKLSSGLAIWFLEKLSEKYTRESYHAFLLRSDLDAVWIEHWPPWY